MNQIKIFRDFANLSPEAQQVVADLVALLSKQKEGSKSSRKMKSTRLIDEAFIGLWQDREEMSDSTKYVRNLRQQSCGKKRLRQKINVIITLSLV